MSIAWEPIESDPDVLNEKIGVTSVKFVDVCSFDDKLPEPQMAVVLSVPQYEKYEELMKATEGGKPSDVFFVIQKIPNSSGSLSVFHCLANLEGSVSLGDGPLKQWLAVAKPLSPEERSQSLADNSVLTNAHAEAASSGRSGVPAKVQNHFVAFVLKDGQILEIDSRSASPRTVGSSNDKTFVADVGNIVKNLMEKVDDAAFSAVALIPA